MATPRCRVIIAAEHSSVTLCHVAQSVMQVLNCVCAEAEDVFTPHWIVQLS